MLAVGLPLAVAVAVAGGFVLVRRALRPVARIGAKAEEHLAAQPERAAAGGAHGDELERLSMSLNHMITPSGGGDAQLQAIRRGCLATSCARR